MPSTARICWSRSGSAASTTWTSRSASAISSSVARNARDELLRQIADEADGVGDHDLALVREPQPAADRIERREQLVGGERVALGERVEQRRLAGVRVAADRDDRHLAIGAALAAQPAIVGELLEPLLEQVDPLARAAAVDLELGLAGAARRRCRRCSRDIIVFFSTSRGSA